MNPRKEQLASARWLKDDGVSSNDERMLHSDMSKLRRTRGWMINISNVNTSNIRFRGHTGTMNSRVYRSTRFEQMSLPSSRASERPALQSHK